MARSAGARSAEPTAQSPGIFVIVALGLLRLGLLLATLGLAGGALAALLGFVVPALDLFNHFQAVLLAGLMVVVIAVPLCFIGQPWQLQLTGIAMLGLLASGWTTVPEIAAGLSPRMALPSDGRPVLKLMTHNLFGLNYDMARVAGVIAAEDPDIIALQEFFPEQRETLPALLKANYPYSIYCTGGRRANVALYSKLPFEAQTTGACAGSAGAQTRITRIIGTFTLAGGQKFSVLTTHLDWPFPIARQQQEAADLIAAVKAVRGPLLVVGDFNSTPWSFIQRNLAAAAGLVRQTHGTLTYPLRLWFAGWRNTLPFLPLDQVMTRGIDIHELHAGARSGSDHLPIVTSFSVDPSAG
jgi:endonuclease/exonuclease/phosphatase (EEP) superfamily protein YafD